MRIRGADKNQDCNEENRAHSSLPSLLILVEMGPRLCSGGISKREYGSIFVAGIVRVKRGGEISAAASFGWLKSFRDSLIGLCFN